MTWASRASRSRRSFAIKTRRWWISFSTSVVRPLPLPRRRKEQVPWKVDTRLPACKIASADLAASKLLTN
jgi:hypothetical protein